MIEKEINLTMPVNTLVTALDYHEFNNIQHTLRSYVNKNLTVTELGFHGVYYAILTMGEPSDDLITLAKLGLNLI